MAGGGPPAEAGAKPAEEPVVEGAGRVTGLATVNSSARAIRRSVTPAKFL